MKGEKNHIKIDLLCDLQINVLPESSVYNMIWKYLLDILKCEGLFIQDDR